MILARNPEQVTERLDRLIAKIRDIQRPHMDGSKPVDVVVVCTSHDLCLQLCANALQVAHGTSLRCFVKRWLGYPLDSSLALMLSPGAIGILRYGIFARMKILDANKTPQLPQT